MPWKSPGFNLYLMTLRWTPGTALSLICGILLIAPVSPFYSQTPRNNLEREIVSLHKKLDSYLQKKDSESAILIARLILKKQPYLEKNRYDLALLLLYSKVESTESRIRYFEEALDHLLTSEDVLLHTGLSEELAKREFHAGIAAWWLGHRDQALRLFISSYKNNPALEEARYNQAFLYEEMGKKEKAVEIYRELSTTSGNPSP